MRCRRLPRNWAQLLHWVKCQTPDTEKFDVVGATIVKDVAGEFVAAYSPAINTGYLIRPDGHIGYCGRPMTERGVFDYLRTLSGLDAFGS
jgi:hypothetical protein